MNLKFEATKTWKYIRLLTLLKMNRSTVEVIDPKTKAKDVYEGVALKGLVSGSPNYEVRVFRGSIGFNDKQVVIDPSLTPRSEVILADTLNGKRLDRENPFCLIAITDRGGQVVVKNLEYIELAGTP